MDFGIVGGVLTLIGVLASNNAKTAVLNQRMEDLTPGSPGAQQLCKANAGGGGADQGY